MNTPIVEDMTSEERENFFRNQAQKSFANHELTIVSEDKHAKVYRCHDPERGNIFSFNIIESCGSIFLTGDIGTFSLNGSVPWLRGSVRWDYISGYVMSKAHPVYTKDQVFVTKNIPQYLSEMAKDLELDGECEDNIYLLALQEYKDRMPYDEERMIPDIYDALSEHIDDVYEFFESFFGYSMNSMWCYFAMCKFVELYNAHLESEPDTDLKRN